MAILRLVCLLVCITAGASSALEDDNDVVVNYAPYDITWQDFKKEYGRQYSKEDEKVRYTAFVERLKTIEAHNKKYLAQETSFFMGIGPFADRLPDDAGFSCDVLDDEDPIDRSGRQKRQTGFCRAYTPSRNFTPATSLDWRTKGAVTPVGNQGSCGSCYSFGAAATLEAQLKFSKGTLIELSKQQFVDCHKKDCDGSTAESAFSYVYYAGGIMSEADYPYRPENLLKIAKAGPCVFQESKVKTQLSGCLYSLGNETRLRYMVASQGPVYISFAVSPSFLGYKGGVYSDTNCTKLKSSLGRHCLTVVGYGRVSGKDCWIVKNSWETTWGVKGYAYIQRGVNMCGIADKTTVPVIGGKFNRGKAVLTDTHPDTYSPTGAVEDEDDHAFEDEHEYSVAAVVISVLACLLLVVVIGVVIVTFRKKQDVNYARAGRDDGASSQELFRI